MAYCPLCLFTETSGIVFHVGAYSRRTKTATSVSKFQTLFTLENHVRLQLTNNDVADRLFEPLDYGSPKTNLLLGQSKHKH